MVVVTIQKSKLFFKKNLLVACCLLLFACFIVEVFYALSLKSKLLEREKQLEQAVAAEEEEVVTPAMLRDGM